MKIRRREEMKRIYTTSILILLLAAGLSGCKNAATSTNNDTKPAQPPTSNSNQVTNPSPSNSNASIDKSSATASAAAASTGSKLFGTYEMSEVHSGGVVNMISQMKTELTFLSDGNYMRISRRNGKIYHSDAGNYRIEGNDQLVLLIKFAKQKVNNPPLERKHTFTLSRDGEELRMTSEDGKVAVFRKVRKA
jgi:PBP1b-binding outer membrane lipoprotein LpoB